MGSFDDGLKKMREERERGKRLKEERRQKIANMSPKEKKSYNLMKKILWGFLGFIAFIFLFGVVVDVFGEEKKIYSNERPAEYDIYYNVDYDYDKCIAENGQDVVIKDGKTGTKADVKTVKILGGTEFEQETEKDVIIKKPVDKNIIVCYGNPGETWADCRDVPLEKGKHDTQCEEYRKTKDEKLRFRKIHRGKSTEEKKDDSEKIEKTGPKEAKVETAEQAEPKAQAAVVSDGTDNINPDAPKPEGYCEDGAPAYGDPSARGRANSCYGHGGWAD